MTPLTDEELDAESQKRAIAEHIRNINRQILDLMDLAITEVSTRITTGSISDQQLINMLALCFGTCGATVDVKI